MYVAQSVCRLSRPRTRYINRSNIIHNQPYSIRIEAYELNLYEPIRLIAVWFYPIYFDFLQSFRFVKILRLFKSDISTNPCRNNPCNQYQVCYPIMNQNSSYICLCPNNFKGNDCSIKDDKCNNDFCSSNALCKPNYRGLLNGNERPYCICPLNQIGDRCELIHDKCNPNPCQNNGICFTTSTPDRFSCTCTKEYYGNTCELEKQSLKLYINQSTDHTAAVVQYFYINFYSLDLILLDQHLYDKLPNMLHYLHNEIIILKIILVKLYINKQMEIYLISIHMNSKSMNTTIQLNEINRCIHVKKLFQIRTGTSQMNLSLSFFLFRYISNKISSYMHK